MAERSLPSALKAAICAQSSGEAVITLLKIQHDELDASILLCNDKQNLTYDGEVYTSFPFTFDLPDVVEGTIPTALVTLDNVDLSIITQLASLTIDPPKCLVSQVLASDPATLIWPFVEFELGDLDSDNTTITVPLVVAVTSDEPFPAPLMDEYHFPAAYNKPAATDV